MAGWHMEKHCDKEAIWSGRKVSWCTVSLTRIICLFLHQILIAYVSLIQPDLWS